MFFPRPASPSDRLYRPGGLENQSSHPRELGRPNRSREPVHLILFRFCSPYGPRAALLMPGEPTGPSVSLEKVS